VARTSLNSTDGRPPAAGPTGPDPSDRPSLRDTLSSFARASRRLGLSAGSGARGPGRRRLFVGVCLLLALPIHAAWLKGNLHTHTNQSDGDSAPDAVAAWYAHRGYDFLVITDHDKVTRVENAPLLLIPGEEITDRLDKKPLHVNAIGIDEAIAPQRGTTIVENLQRNVDAVVKRGGIALVNHPNFGWAFGADELLQVKNFTLLEIASGHQFVNAQGPPSVESMWDRLLTAGRRVWGVAVDDSHHLKDPLGVESVPPGRAWVCVQSGKRDAAAILEALRRGDFYASNGPELEDYSSSNESIRVRVRERHGARYRIQFIGSGGSVLQESQGSSATYAIRGNERYVRAKVLDSNGKAAWLQPFFVTTK
jgi:hypothetical protein